MLLPSPLPRYLRHRLDSNAHSDHGRRRPKAEECRGGDEWALRQRRTPKERAGKYAPPPEHQRDANATAGSFPV